MTPGRTDPLNRSLFLAALRPRAGEGEVELSRQADKVDWEWLLERAAAHKVEALLARGLGVMGIEASAPDAVRERLQRACAQAQGRYEKAVEDLSRVDDCLRRAGIAYILIKGPVLSRQVYDSPARRRFFDLDIVVREEQVDATQAALEGLGYRLWGGDRYLGFAPASADGLAAATRAMRRSLKRFAHELALVTEEHRLLPIDVHWHLLPRGRIRAAAAAQLWEDLQTVTLDGIEVRVLPPEAMLLHLAMHCWDNRPWSFALLHLCDVAWALDRLPIAAERLADLARRWGGSADLGRALYAVEHVLGMPVPAAMTFAASPPSRRFKRLVRASTLVERYARPAPDGWARRRAEMEWGLAMGTLSSTAILLLGKYTALLRYYIERRG